MALNNRVMKISVAATLAALAALVLVGGAVLAQEEGDGVTRTVVTTTTTTEEQGVGALRYGERRLSVSGAGFATGAPDIAYVQLGVDITSNNPAEAFNQGNTTINRVVEAIVATGVSATDIQTSGFNMFVQDNFNSAGQRTGVRTYFLQNVLTITVRDVAQAAEIINVAIGAGANSINGLAFGIDDTSALIQTARQEAIAEAQTNAAEVAASLGVNVGEVLVITETVRNNSRPDTAFSNAAGSDRPAVNTGLLSVEVQVDVTFALELPAGE